ncbi:MAG: hypothetical protein Q8P18_16885 [Pseudomonadota bacterium]|nr:hypothetical protein [Pseudomonadota bacterium]
MRLPWIVLLVIAGCRRTPVDEAETGPSFTFSVNGPAVVGQPVEWSASLVTPNGDPLQVDVYISSDLEPALTQDETTLTAFVAGWHTLTAVGDVFENAYQAEVLLDVAAGPAALLDLALDANQAVAGEPLGFTVTAFDAFGNPLDGAVVSSDSADLAVVAPNVVSTVPALYTLTASLDDVVDVEMLRVVAAEPVELDLTLSDVNLEIYETTSATAVAYDVYGNPVDIDWDLSVESVGATSLSGHNVTFLSEGYFVVWARYLDLEDYVGPLLIDSTGPTLDIDTPERGTFSTDAATNVSGTVTDNYTGVTSLTVGGEEVAVESDGSFSTSVENVFGLNILESEALDGDGNATTDTRAVLAGAFLPYGNAVGEGVAARINQGGFDTLEALGEGLINGTDLSGALPSPAFSTESESCIDLLFDEICITWYSIALYVTNPYLGGTDLELDPDAGGWINGTFTVYSPSIDWAADGDVIGIGYSGSGQIYANSITIDMDLQPYVIDGVLGVNVLAVDVTSDGFTFDWDSWIYDVMGFFGLDLSGLIQSAMEDAVEGVIADEVPSLMADAVGSLEIATDLEIEGGVYSFDAEPSYCSVDDLGMTLGLGTTFTTSMWNHGTEGPGSLSGDYSLPLYASGTPDMQLSLSLDFMNQALYAFWGGGLLDRTLGEQELGLDLGSLSTFLPFSSLSIQTEAMLPPVLVPGTGGGLLDLQIGDLAMTLFDGAPEDGNVVFQVYASIVVELDLDVSAEGTLLPSLGETTIWFDVVVPSAGTEASGDAEALLGALVPMLLPSLTEGLGEIPIPAISGFTLGIESIALDGAESGYVNVNGNLSVD